MGFGGIGIWQLLIILLIVIMIFGTKRLKSLGGDLGGALKSFRKAMDSDEDKGADPAENDAGDERKQIENDDDGDAQFEEQKVKESRE